MKTKPKLMILKGAVRYSIASYAESSHVRKIFHVEVGQKIKSPPDVVFCQSWGQCLSELLGWRGKKVVHIGGSPFLEWKGKKLDRALRVVAGAKRVMCVSKFLVDEFAKHGDWPAVRSYPAGLWGLDHTPTGIMPQRFEPKKNYEFGSRPRIVMSMPMRDGEIKESKWRGLDLFLNAIADLIKKYDVEIICAGRGDPHFGMIAKWGSLTGGRFVFRQQHHLDDKVDRWPGTLHESDIFVHPSTFDSWGRVVADAMCAGLPCLVFDVPGPNEVGENVVLCDPESTTDIRDKLRWLLVSQATRQELGIRARAEAVRKTKANQEYLAGLLRRVVDG